MKFKSHINIMLKQNSEFFRQNIQNKVTQFNAEKNSSLEKNKLF